jgi:hypothetical protein
VETTAVKKMKTVEEDANILRLGRIKQLVLVFALEQTLDMNTSAICDSLVSVVGQSIGWSAVWEFMELLRNQRWQSLHKNNSQGRLRCSTKCFEIFENKRREER